MILYKVLAPIWIEFQETGVVEDLDASTEGEGIKMYLRKKW